LDILALHKGNEYNQRDKCQQTLGSCILPDSARLLAVRKINTNCMCSHVIFIVFFKFCLENADGDGFIAHTSALEMTQLLNVLITNNT
jgi:hypothetical protein